MTPIKLNLQVGWLRGPIFDIWPQNDHIYSNIHMYFRIFNILLVASFKYAMNSNLAATDPLLLYCN